jgi:phage major head subunit gpT-like protein
MAVMTREDFVTVLTKMIDETFLTSLEEMPSVYDKIFNIVRENKPERHELSLFGLGLFRRTQEGGEPDFETLGEGYETVYRPVKFRKGVAVTRETLEDDPQHLIPQIGPQLARAARYSIEYNCASIFDLAFSTSRLGADGKPLCAVDHPLAASTATAANKPSTDIALSPAGLKQLRLLIKIVPDDRNLPFPIKPAILLIPPALRDVADEILHSQAAPYTAENQPNVLQNAFEIVEWYALTSQTAWFILAAKSDHRIKLIERQPLYTDSDYSKRFEMYYYYAGFRHDYGWSDWRGVVGTAGA